jgi:hypothetical protein
MGGPIKEGIMHGIREPYRGGGQAALVGNPVYPQTGGREHHNVAKTIFGNVGKLFGGSGGWWSKIKPTGKFRQPPVPKGYPTKDVAGQYGSKFNVKGKGFEGPAPYTKMEIAKNPRLMWEGIKENPVWAGAAGVYGAAPAYAIAKGTVPAVVKTAADFAVPDFIYNWETGKWFNPDDKDIKKIDKKAILQGNVSAKGPATEDTSTAESRAAFAKKRQDIRVKKYLDLMGYDRSKKTAIADALIDASKIVSDRGTLDKKNITAELINPLIQATSKRFDKPEQIREAVGLMMTKAGLEKEMYDAKPGTQLKAAQDYVSQFGGSMDNAYKQLGLTKKGNFTESLGALAKQYDKGPENQKVLIENIKFQKANEPGFNIDSIKVLEDSDFLEKAQEQEDFVSVTDTILRHPDAHTEVDGKLVPKPGVYLMGNAVVEVFEDGTTKRLN